MDTVLPTQARYLLATAETSRDFFSDDLTYTHRTHTHSSLNDWSAPKIKAMELRPHQVHSFAKLQPRLRQHKLTISKFSLFSFMCRHVENLIEIVELVRQEAQQIDALLDQVRTALTPKQLGTMLVCVHEVSEK